MAHQQRFDGIIIGTGQAGRPLATALAEAGWRVAIIERGRVGGTCVLCGCTPSKTMVASARVAHLSSRAAEYGVDTGSVQVDMAAVRKRTRQVVDRFTDGARDALQEQDGVELIFGEARFVAPHELDVRLNDGGTRTITADNIFINAGTRPLVPSLPGLDEVGYLDSTSIMELSEVPEHLLILGGGFIGLEFAQMFRRFGSRVTIVERGAQLASREDEDIAAALEEILVEDGVTVHTSSEVEAVERAGDGGITLRVRHEGGESTVAGSHLLAAVGRTPNTDSLGVEMAGLELDEQGYIEVNERLETGVEGIYALGEIAGTPPFTHMAYDDFRVLRDNLLADGERDTRDRLMPYTLFTDPQLGRIGVTEKQAREKGLNIKVATMPMERVARAIEFGETRGLTRVVIDADTDLILGAAVLGMEGGELAAVLQTAMMGKLPYTALRDGIFSHPTLAEALNNVFASVDE